MRYFHVTVRNEDGKHCSFSLESALFPRKRDMYDRITGNYLFIVNIFEFKDEQDYLSFKDES